MPSSRDYMMPPPGVGRSAPPPRLPERQVEESVTQPALLRVQHQGGHGHGGGVGRFEGHLRRQKTSAAAYVVTIPTSWVRRTV